MDFIWTNNPKRFKIEKEKIKSMQFEPLCLICKHPEVLLNTEFTDIRFFNVLPMCGFESPSKIDASIFFATSLQNSKHRFCGVCCFLYVQKMKTRHSESVEGCGSPAETSAYFVCRSTDRAGRRDQVLLPLPSSSRTMYRSRRLFL